MDDDVPVNKAGMVAGAALVIEGTMLVTRGRRYVDFVERQGLIDVGKRLMIRFGVRSPAVFAAVGLTELVLGLVLLRRAS